MSGSKKINTAFINRFEKSYCVKFHFKLSQEKEDYMFPKIDEKRDFRLKIDVTKHSFDHEYTHFSLKQNSRSMFNISDVEFEEL